MRQLDGRPHVNSTAVVDAELQLPLQEQPDRGATWPHFDEEEIAAATRILRSGKINYWTGPEGKSFEREYADYFGVRHAVALTNGSVALELALHALDLQPGDEVVVTPRTFLASVSAAILQNLDVVFADVDRDSGNITAESIEKVITPKTKAIIPVHLGGWPCEMPAIMQLAKAKNLYVIEDCAQSHAATIDGRYAGTFGDINSWSFCQDKIITTGGEGGMITTENEDWWKRAWSFKDHGKDYDAVFNKNHAPGFRWLHNSFGTNWRLTEIQSAIGRIQLRKLKDWVGKRRANAQVLIDRLSNIEGVRVPVPRNGIEHAYYRFYLYLEPNVLKSGVTRDMLVDQISRTGVPAFSGSCSEVYLEKAFDGRPYRPHDRLPVAKELGETSLAFLVHPTLTAEDMHRTAGAFIDAFGQFKR